MRPSSDLRGALTRLGLAEHGELLAPFATIELSLVPDDDGLARIGGSPDLPPEYRWPAHDDKPLPFLMQIDLAALDVPDKRLPDRGVLAFFAAVTSDVPDPLFAKRVAAHVAYFPDAGVLRLRAHPPTSDEPPANRVKLRVERSIHWRIPFEDMARVEAALPGEGFTSLVRDMRRTVHALFPAPSNECIGPMPPFGEVALLRLCDDPLADFHVGDASWLTYSISELDLRARRFDGARASVFIG
ncbi:MAG TPA: DUF1963 domain-containing protein [Kofleriaceae bacterium]